MSANRLEENVKRREGVVSGLSVIPLSERQGLNQTICKCHNVAYTLCFNLRYGDSVTQWFTHWTLMQTAGVKSLAVAFV